MRNLLCTVSCKLLILKENRNIYIGGEAPCASSVPAACAANFLKGSNDSRPSRLLWHGTIAPGAQFIPKKGHLMFLILAVVLVLLWLGGFFILHVSSFLIHLLLLFALISIIMNFVGGRRAV
jgi:Family of unknown function (DUF5670)